MKRRLTRRADQSRFKLSCFSSETGCVSPAGSKLQFEKHCAMNLTHYKDGRLCVSVYEYDGGEDADDTPRFGYDLLRKTKLYVASDIWHFLKMFFYFSNFPCFNVYSEFVKRCWRTFLCFLLEDCLNVEGKSAANYYCSVSLCFTSTDFKDRSFSSLCSFPWSQRVYDCVFSLDKSK